MAARGPSLRFPSPQQVQRERESKVAIVGALAAYQAIRGTPQPQAGLPPPAPPPPPAPDMSAGLGGAPSPGGMPPMPGMGSSPMPGLGGPPPPGGGMPLMGGAPQGMPQMAKGGEVKGTSALRQNDTPPPGVVPAKVLLAIILAKMLEARGLQPPTNPMQAMTAPQISQPGAQTPPRKGA